MNCPAANDIALNVWENGWQDLEQFLLKEFCEFRDSGQDKLESAVFVDGLPGCMWNIRMYRIQKAVKINPTSSFYFLISFTPSPCSVGCFQRETIISENERLNTVYMDMMDHIAERFDDRLDDSCCEKLFRPDY